MTYYRSQSVDGTFDAVLDRTVEALSEEGFGVLSDIDVAGTLEEKLGVEDFGDYRILGACIPPLAHEALEAEKQLGTVLPCNVIVYEDGDGQVTVAAVDPTELLSVVDNPELDEVAEEVDARFDRVFATLSAPQAAD
ncbi:MAG: DUF302 domain-containing protein [Halodesulfurarchaeum sp.]